MARSGPIPPPHLLRWAGIACLSALLTSGVVSAVAKAYDSPRADQLSEYVAGGEALIHGVRAEHFGVTDRMPLSTMLAAGLRHHSGFSENGAAVFYQIAAVVLILLLAFALGGLLHPRGGFFAAAGVSILFCGDRPFTFYPDSGYAALILLTACLLAWRARSPSPGRSALLAAAIGASLLYRSPLAFFPPLLALYEFGAYHRFSLRSCWKDLLILCAVPYLFLLPWLALNWTLSRQLIPFEQGLSPNSNIVAGALGLVQGVEGDYGSLLDGSIDASRNSVVLGWAAKEVMRHPLRYAGAVMRRIWFALSLHPLPSILAIAALAFYRRRREYQELGLLAGYLLGVTCLMAVLERYFWPMWPVTAVLAASLFAGVSPLGSWTEALERRSGTMIMAGALIALVAAGLYANAAVASYAAAQGQGWAEETEKTLSRELERCPDDSWLLLRRARERTARGALAEAAEDYAAAARAEPGDLRSRLQLARARAGSGKPFMILQWRAAPDAPPEIQFDVSLIQANIHLGLGQTDKAEAILRKAFEFYAQGNSFVHGPQGEREKDAASKMRASDRGFVVSCLAAMEDRSFERREALLRVLTKLLPESGEAWLRRAELAAKMGRRDQAALALARLEKLPLSFEQRRRIQYIHADLAPVPAEPRAKQPGYRPSK